MKDIHEIKSEVELLSNRTQRKLEAMSETDEHNAKTYGNYLRRSRKLEATMDAILTTPETQEAIIKPQAGDFMPNFD